MRKKLGELQKHAHRILCGAGSVAIALLATAVMSHAQGLQPGGPIDFGTIAVGSTSSSYTVNFSATSATTISSVSALTEGVSDKDFTVVSQTCVGTIQPPQSCTVAIAFSPSTPGLRRGALALTNAAGTIVNEVFLHGVGQGPQLTVSPATGQQITSVSPDVTPVSFTVGGVVVAADGTTYFNDSQYQRLFQRTPTGVYSVLSLMASSADTAMAIDGAGTLYFTSGSLVYSLVPGGNPTVFATGGNTLSSPSGLAVDAQGYVYIADSSLNKILRVATDGTSSFLTLTGLSTALSSPTALAVDGNSNLYIADTGNNRVVVAGIYSGAATVLTTSVSAPRGVAVDAGGNVVISDTGNARIYMVPATGTPYALPIIGGSTATPRQLALTPSGDLYVADQAGGLLLVTRSAGVITFPTATRLSNLDSTDGSLSGLIQNSGNVPLQFSTPAGTATNWALTGDAFATATGGTCTLLTSASAPVSLAAGSYCSYLVSFTPTAIGTNSGTGIATLTSATGTPATLTAPFTFTGTGVSNTAKFTVAAAPDTLRPGSSTSVTVTAMDASGNVDKTYVGTITLSTGDTAATFTTTTYTFTTADAGVHVFTNGVTYNTLGTYTVGVTDGTATGTSNNINVVLANGFTIVATPTVTSVGGYISYTVTATFNGTLVTDFVGPVTFATGDAAAKFATAAYTFTTADKGTHTFATTAGVQYNTPGTYTITASASAGAATGTSNSILVTNATAFTIVAAPTTVNVSGDVGYTVTAVANGTQTPFTGTVTFTTTDAAASFLNGTTYTFTTADNGAHTFTTAQGVQFNTPGSQTITATSGSLTGTSNTVTVVGVNGFTLTAAPTSTAIGAPVALTVQATFNGTVVPSYTGTVTFTATDATAKFLSGTSYTFTTADNGTHTFPAAAGVQFNTAGVFTVSATDSKYSGTSNAVTVGGVNGFTITATPSVTGLGTPVSYTISATYNGVVVPSYIGTVSFTSTDTSSKFLSGTTYTFTTADNGTHTFAAAAGVQFNTLGTWTISANDGASFGTSNQVQVVAANGFTLTASPSMIGQGASVALTVAATYNGTVVPGYTGTVNFSATDPAASFLSGTSYTFTAADAGTHTFAADNGVQFNTLGTWTIGATDGTLSGTSNDVQVVALTGFTVTATPDTTTVGTPVSFTVTAMNGTSIVTDYTGTVTFSTTDPVAKFLAGTTYTFTAGDAGTHTFTAASAGVEFNTTGVFTVVATAGSQSGTSNNVTVTGPAGFTLTAAPDLTMPGAPVALTIAATTNGVVNTNYTGTVTFSTTDTTAKFLSGTSYTFTSADGGTHTFPAASGVQFNTLGSYSVAATDGTLTGQSNLVRVVNPDAFTVVASPATTTIGTPVGYTVSATYGGVVVQGYTGTATFTTTDTTAKLLSGTTYTFTTADASTHTFASASGAQFNAAGTFTISATDGTRSGVSNDVVVSSKPVAAFTIVATPATTTVGAPVGLSVTAVDSTGAAITDYTGTVVFTTTDAAAKLLSGASYTFTTADKGTHTFAAASGVQFNTVGTFTITGTSGSVTGISNSVTVTAAPAAAFTVVAAPSTTTVGTPVGLTVTAVDANGATATAYTGTVAFTTTDATAKFLAGTTYTFTTADNGTHTFPSATQGITFNTAGTYTVTAASGTLTGVSNDVVVSNAPATGFSIVATPAAIAVGGTVSFTVTATSATGATAAGYTGTVAFTSSDAAAKFLAGTTYTFTTADAGVHTFSAPSNGAQLNTVGTQTITATSSTLTGTSNGVLVSANNPATVTTLTSSANPVLTGSTITLTAAVTPGTTSSVVPTGTVVFTEGGAQIGSVTLVNGIATLNNVLLTVVGTHNLVATYQGDSNYSGSVSSLYPQVVEDFAIAVASDSSSALSVYGGNPATYKLLVSPLGASTLAAPIAFTVTGAPTGSKITLTPSSLASGAAATNVSVSITPPLAVATVQTRGQRLAPLTLALFGLPLLVFTRRRRIAKLLMLALVAIPLTAMTGCLNSQSDGYYGGPSKTYQVVVTGTSGTLSRSVTLTLSVQ
ncbi:MAG: Ig-like domain repeat protein [Acidobacteriaceae bacterium]|nr:Ig-like domain repeat protein [Acidobacteriaceae bacterium]